uniref:Protein kinase domain-containing protein n=1 Tax=Ascaris lumbricoides TaxID=6252 RepID=A0A0M3ISV3_ASCLU
MANRCTKILPGNKLIEQCERAQRFVFMDLRSGMFDSGIVSPTPISSINSLLVGQPPSDDVARTIGKQRSTMPDMACGCQCVRGRC